MIHRVRCFWSPARAGQLRVRASQPQLNIHPHNSMAKAINLPANTPQAASVLGPLSNSIIACAPRRYDDYPDPESKASERLCPHKPPARLSIFRKHSMIFMLIQNIRNLRITDRLQSAWDNCRPTALSSPLLRHMG